MRALAEILASYGRYHRDPRNRLTHYVGVPVIIYSLLLATASFTVTLAGFPTPVARVLVAAAALAYLFIDLRLGLALAASLVVLAAAAEATTALGLPLTRALAAVLFVVGWIIQFFGHHLEGNRPALFTNLLQIFVAPLFLTAELGFALGARKTLRDDVRIRTERPSPPRAV